MISVKSRRPVLSKTVGVYVCVAFADLAACVCYDISAAAAGVLDNFADTVSRCDVTQVGRTYTASCRAGTCSRPCIVRHCIATVCGDR